MKREKGKNTLGCLLRWLTCRQPHVHEAVHVSLEWLVAGIAALRETVHPVRRHHRGDREIVRSVRLVAVRVLAMLAQLLYEERLKNLAGPLHLYMLRADSDYVLCKCNQPRRQQHRHGHAHLGRDLLVLWHTVASAVRIGAAFAHGADVRVSAENEVVPVPRVVAHALGDRDDGRVAVVGIVAQRGDGAADELDDLVRVAGQVLGRE